MRLSPHEIPWRDIPGEACLVAGVIRQALHDARSPHAALRTDALAFLSDEEAMGAWCALGGLDLAYVQRLVAAALAPAEARRT